MSVEMIDQGSRVLLIDDRGKKHITTAARGMVDVSGLGVVDGDVLCGSDWGNTISIGARTLVLVKPDINDMLELIERKAQIMMPKDSYQIPQRLGIGAGCRVIEAGVGSGALALVLIEAVAPTGIVFSYEAREDHAAIARRNVSMSAHSGCWELKIDDICTANLEKDVDAVVLDMPNPWDAMANCCASLKPGGRICAYVPNMNQLENTVRSMEASRLAEILSFEVLQREIVVHHGGVRPSSEMIGHTGYLIFGRRIRE